MLIAYVLLALLAVALVAVAVIKVRSRGARQASQPAADASEPRAPAVPADIHADRPDAAGGMRDVDPNATLIHRRRQPAAAPAAQPKRTGAAPAAAAARLVGLSGSRKDASYPVSATGITIGRSASCDVVLADHRVSSRHAWIGIVDGKFVLRDLKSTNGTFINTQTQSAIGEIELRNGDTIFFGSHQGDQFRFLTN